MKQMKGLIGVLILSAATLSGCHSGSSSSNGPCLSSFTYCRLSSVSYGAGEFVAVGGATDSLTTGDGNPRIEVSTDGIDWTAETVQYTPAQLAQANELQSITYGKEGFVATDGVHVLHSADGLNWTIEPFQSTSGKITYVIYDGTRYILYSSPGVTPLDNPDNFPWKVSIDGVNWTDYGMVTITNGPAGEPRSIIHVAGMYEAAWQPAGSVTGPTRYLTASSPDGLSWTLGNPVPVTNLPGNPRNPTVTPVAPVMYDILHTGDQYILFGGTDEFPVDDDSWGVALYGSSMSAMTMVSPLTAQNGGEGFRPVGDPMFGAATETHGLVSNGAAIVALGEGGLFVSTDGITWTFESMDGVVPDTGCSFAYPGTPTCTAFASGAAAPGGSMVVLVTEHGGITAGAETMDGIHWVKSNL